jgi:hypothetical protein
MKQNNSIKLAAKGESTCLSAKVSIKFSDKRIFRKGSDP